MANEKKRGWPSKNQPQLSADVPADDKVSAEKPAQVADSADYVAVKDVPKGDDLAADVLTDSVVKYVAPEVTVSGLLEKLEASGIPEELKTFEDELDELLAAHERALHLERDIKALGGPTLRKHEVELKRAELEALRGEAKRAHAAFVARWQR